jgi:predicted nucleic acid-binding protein
MHHKPGLVLDTQVAMDWLLFGDPGTAPLAAAITSGAVHWLATPAMRAEFERVAVLRAWPGRDDGEGDGGGRLAAFDRWTHIQPEPPASPPALRCRDADDQVFIDLALAAGACLLSRDKAVLALARRALPLGLRILQPQAWP